MNWVAIATIARFCLENPLLVSPASPEDAHHEDSTKRITPSYCFTLRRKGERESKGEGDIYEQLSYVKIHNSEIESYK